MIFFFKSKNIKIFKKILLTFLNIINSSREMILYYQIDIKFKYMISKFNDIEFIDIKYWDLLLNIIYIYNILKVDNWDIFSSFYEWRDK